MHQHCSYCNVGKQSHFTRRDDFFKWKRKGEPLRDANKKQLSLFLSPSFYRMMLVMYICFDLLMQQPSTYIYVNRHIYKKVNALLIRPNST